MICVTTKIVFDDGSEFECDLIAENAICYSQALAHLEHILTISTTKRIQEVHMKEQKEKESEGALCE